MKIPQSCVLVVANSLTISEKAKSARFYYNKSVVECILASKIRSKSIHLDNWKNIITFFLKYIIYYIYKYIYRERERERKKKRKRIL